MLFKILVYPLAMGDFHRHSHILERQFYCPIDNRSTPFLHFSNNFSSAGLARPGASTKSENQSTKQAQNAVPRASWLVARRSPNPGSRRKGRRKPQTPYLVSRISKKARKRSATAGTLWRIRPFVLGICLGPVRLRSEPALNLVEGAGFDIRISNSPPSQPPGEGGSTKTENRSTKQARVPQITGPKRRISSLAVVGCSSHTDSTPGHPTSSPFGEQGVTCPPAKTGVCPL